MSKFDQMLTAAVADQGNRAIGHAVSLATIFTTLDHMLPEMAMLAPIAWYAVCIYESKTIQNWKRRRRHVARAKRRLRNERLANRSRSTTGTE